jgi:hypothetical protein
MLEVSETGLLAYFQTRTRVPSTSKAHAAHLSMLREEEGREWESVGIQQYEGREEPCRCQRCERERPRKKVVEIWKREGKMMLVRRGRR